MYEILHHQELGCCSYVERRRICHRIRRLNVPVEFTVSVHVGIKQAQYSAENVAVSSVDECHVKLSKSANLLEPKAFAPCIYMQCIYCQVQWKIHHYVCLYTVCNIN